MYVSTASLAEQHITKNNVILDCVFTQLIKTLHWPSTSNLNPAIWWPDPLPSFNVIRLSPTARSRHALISILAYLAGLAKYSTVHTKSWAVEALNLFTSLRRCSVRILSSHILSSLSTLPKACLFPSGQMKLSQTHALLTRPAMARQNNGLRYSVIKTPQS